jgi:hypothetical protein
MEATATKSAVSLALLLVCGVLLGLAPSASADAVWGTGLVFEATDPEFEGYFEYCYHIYWDTRDYGGHGLSHTTIFLALADCECACDVGYFDHRVPAGLGFGEESCEVTFYSEFDCWGDPHFPVPGPTMKFEPEEGECEPGVTGWVHVCYYSLFPPTPAGVFDDHLGIKFGQNVETGDLDGVLPYCECDANPVGTPTWGTIKSVYR